MYCFYYTFLSLKKKKKKKPHNLPNNKKKRRKICFNKYDVRKPDQYVDRPIRDYTL